MTEPTDHHRSQIADQNSGTPQVSDQCNPCPLINTSNYTPTNEIIKLKQADISRRFVKVCETATRESGDHSIRVSIIFGIPLISSL